MSNDLDEKIKEWAKDPKPQPEIPAPRMPKFKPQKFSSYAEMNAWKAALLKQYEREGSPKD